MVQFTKLYGLTSKGAVKEWQITVNELCDGSGEIVRVHGLVGSDKLQHNHKIIKKGKNIGKKNETTPVQQATKDATSLWNKQIDSGYSENSDGKTSIRLPMLAQKLKNQVVYPAMAQRKYDGVRCLAEKTSSTEIKFTSRRGKSYDATLGHLVEPLLELMEVGEILDGEIYKHG